MNVIIDLTARAVSFITTIQSTLLAGTMATKSSRDNNSILNLPKEEFETVFYSFIHQKNNAMDDEGVSFSQRAVELVWVGQKKLDHAGRSAATEYAALLCTRLANWVRDNKENGLSELLSLYGPFPTPFNWRDAISSILYKYPEQRVMLAEKLHYLPIQVRLAAGAGKKPTPQQRILQLWQVPEEWQLKLLTEEEQQVLDEFPQLEAQTAPAEEMLRSSAKLLNFLKQQQVPLSFQQVFTDELKEIYKNRKHRYQEQGIATYKDLAEIDREEETAEDPFEKGRNMKLYALTFSGGGIRSATFNLGVLQGLASANLVSKFDYLSTVSGGGYIGSWLTAWIKREGSVVKVTNRLCPDKSPEPLGEELRPIKWLRMYSNYFAPNASIMSADSWTIGITWFRNTLINQIIIFLLLLSFLFGGNLLYLFWEEFIKGTVNHSVRSVIGYSLLFLLPVSLLAGLGMNAYHTEKKDILIWLRNQNKAVSSFILGFAVLASYVLSGWLSSKWYNKDEAMITFNTKLKVLIPIAAVTFVCLLLVAIIGRYIVCIKQYGKKAPRAWFILVVSSALTAAVGAASLYGAWAILDAIDKTYLGTVSLFKSELEFVFGFPLVMEVFSITLVARMAFLGRYFPDERREWWGRMGAITHRLSFLWILISISALLGQHFIKWLFDNFPVSSIIGTGGWTAFIIATLKAAFSAKTSGKDDSGSSFYLNILSLAGPYLFILGLLFYLPALISPLDHLANNILHSIVYLVAPRSKIPVIDVRTKDIIIAVFLSFTCLSIALFLSRQVGVNEFSMHHFYKNRLVRAYLGATRRFADRQRTSNPFTGFDKFDDEKLSLMTNEEGYYGPYPLLNTALNASQESDLDRQDRKAESFVFSPLYCGFDFSMIKSAADANRKSFDYAYRDTKQFAFKDGGPGIGTAMAISGAAVNPNQGYHSSASTAFLLTVFNLQMGWWMGNPRKHTWQRSEPVFGLGSIINNLVGQANTRKEYIALSDGGHFDNMGLYEMIRRRCSYIVVCDAEQDGDFTCEGFAGAIRRCRIDFGTDIQIDIKEITNRTGDRYSAAHYALGNVYYAGDKKDKPGGKLLYIKSSISDTGKEPVDIYEYAKKNKTFPHQTTADQFFDEDQFESYRRLGMYIADLAFSDEKVRDHLNLKSKNKSGGLWDKLLGYLK